MIISKVALPRRTFLRGMGTALALPLLDAMVPALSATAKTAAKPVPRLAFIYVPNGAHMEKWTPIGEGKGFSFSPTLAPLEPVRDRLVVVSGLSSMPAAGRGEGAGDHARAPATWLSATYVKKTEGADVRAGKTVDQVAADVLGKDTRFPSIQLALEDAGMVGNCDTGYACTYLNTLSWSSPTTPLPMQTNPRGVFERLFGEVGSETERRAERQRERSILDSVTQEIARLQHRIGSSDRVRVSEYLDGIRAIERRIQTLEQQEASSVALPALPAGIPDTFDEHAKLMFDLQVLAFQADTTRVSTFMLAREVSQRTYLNIGVPDPHHGLSHHGDDPGKIEKLAKINRYHVQLLAYFLDRLRDTPDGDGSLLDHSLVMYGSCISNGNTHSHRGLPTLLAGGASGHLQGGRHLIYPDDTAQANVLLGVLDKVGIELDSIGDSTGRLSRL